MYCIKCGVQLSAAEKECPLCQTRVFHPDFPQPDGEPLYPADRLPQARPRSLLGQFIVTALFLLPMLIVPIIDLQMGGGIIWSGYVVGALAVAYVMSVLPSWFRRPNPVIFVPCSFVAIGAYLLYINLAVGGNWFLSFAFPVTGAVGLIVTAVVTLTKYVPKGVYFIFGGACVTFGGFMLLLEYLMSITFGFPWFAGWSLYPLIPLVILGGLLIYIGANKPARELLQRKLFI